MKEKLMAMSNWFVKTTVKQKITLGVCTVAVFSMVGLGIYQLIPNQSDGLNLDGTNKTNVTVNEINEAQAAEAEKLANTAAETTPVESVSQTQNEATNVVSNTTTVNTPTTTEDVYIADDGAHYESEPVYSEPAYEEPVYEEPAAASDGGWDGDLGGDGASEWQLSDDAGEYGTGISN
ncbi:hypothetical protein [Acetobacterium woodii]|uniref:Uncharacterized protein n=1 Tax=Acetobacterium woodii (strain ATCC 29683 / DSM 1030 / JCM 2381 / KCTC 1655 / WB1) TaxID=931626 RepID=H6LDF3_ACEWD|nr:hypothetical protein [Acetobacterium woodii]AFA47925.1 hypothetical protein Awo_c11410 [Acetobacterium woodii DSM 1030]